MKRWASAWRDLRIVGRAVWVNLTLFSALLLGGAILLQVTGFHPGAGFLDLLVDAFHMAFLERVVGPGAGLIADLLTFILPLLTLVILGEGALRVAAVYLRRGERREEWDRMVAKTFSGHTVICGVGELGRAVFKRLIAVNPDAEVVLVDARPGILAEVGEVGSNVCHLHGDMTSPATLKAAGCHGASLIILASGNDAFNLEAGFKAFQLHSSAEIWIRLYRSGLADLMDLSTKPNVHFFRPYEQAAEALVSRIGPPGSRPHAADQDTPDEQP